MSLIEFRSKASGGFFMPSATWDAICKRTGWRFSEQGVIEAEAVPEAAKRLAEEIERDNIEAVKAEEARRAREAERAGRFLTYEEEEEERLEALRPAVRFSQRAFPVMEMLREAAKKNVPVMWGVP